MKDAEVVYGDVRAETLQAAKKLQWVQSGEAGMENMDPEILHAAVLQTADDAARGHAEIGASHRVGGADDGIVGMVGAGTALARERGAKRRGY